MKKLTLLLTSIALIGYCTRSNVFAVKIPKPSFYDSKACYTYNPDGSPCDGPPTNCDCKNKVSTSLVTALNNAIANGTVNTFFSNSNNIAAFNLSSEEAMELQTSGVWVLSSMNQQDGAIYYLVGLASVPNTTNPDFVLSVVPSNN